MARGMVVNEAIVSQANTREFDANYKATFGDKQRTPGAARGRWIWDEAQQKLVRPEEYRPPSRALDAPIITDRWYEGTAALDGTDIGSRRKREDYMRAKGYADANDFSPAYFERQKAEQAREQKQERRQVVEEIYRRHRSTPTVERLAPRGTYDE